MRAIGPLEEVEELGPLETFQHPDLARYTHRVAISNERLIRLDGDEVVFRYKDYSQGGVWRTRSLPAEEFIRRFLQHVLPHRFVRIRYFGILANRHRRENLEHARTALETAPPEPSAPQDETWQEMLHRLTGVDPGRCPVCGRGRLHRDRELAKELLASASARAPP